MTYSKPEVAVLGSAASVIQGQGKQSGLGDSPQTVNIPSYDLDE